MKTQRIPQTDSIEELARFWGTHDLTEFEGQLEEVQEPVFERKPATVVMVRLRPEETEALMRVARSRGVQQATLVRQWVLEKLRNARSFAKRR